MAKTPIKTSWNLDLLLNTKELTDIDSYRKQVEKETNKFIAKWRKDTRFLTDPKIMKIALDEYENWSANISIYEKEWAYWWYRQSLDLNDPTVKSKYNQIHSLGTKLINEIQFFSLQITKIPKEEQQKFLSSKELTEYRYFLEKLFEAGKYTLSEPEERIMNLKAKTSSSNWIKMLETLLSKEERTILNEEGKRSLQNFSEIVELTSSPKKKIRDLAAKAFNEILTQHVEVAEHEFNSVLENKQINDEIRGYERPDKARHISDGIETEVVDTLVQSVTENFNIAKRYYKLKAKLFKLPKLAYHERNVPYGKVQHKYAFEDGYNIVDWTLQNLDADFRNIFNTYFRNGQVDVFPRKGKRSGAFCSTTLKSMPVFVFLNYADNLNNVLTMAHEFGHAIHFEFSKKQNALNYDFPMCTAETASTFFEDFVLEEILKECSEEEQLSILMNKLNDDISTIFRQIAFYNFEKDIHSEFRNKGYLSHEELGKLFRKHMISYMGSAVEQSEGSQNWWIYVSHFRNMFYVYSYAFGLLVSKALQRKVKEDKHNIEKVKTFLSSGSIASPKEIFSNLGIDINKISFWEEGINEVNELLNRTEMLAKKLGKV